MIIVQLSHGFTLVSSCVDQRETISEKVLSSSRFSFVLMKNLAKQFVLIAQGILKLDDSQGKALGGRSSLTSESESEMCREDLPMRQRPVKSPSLRLTFSSSSELEESSLEKSRSLRAAHAQDIIF
jgi:hypothetical protein